METLNLIQGSNEWLEFRKAHFPASEYPAVTNSSKFTSRNELMDARKFGIEKEFSSFARAKMDEGHIAEAAFRPIVEKVISDELYPVTGKLEGTLLTASFDGLTMCREVGFEHKLYNKDLAAMIVKCNENNSQDHLSEHYKGQLDQQLLVSGAKYIIFVTSDGTEAKHESMKYYPDLIRLEIIENTWLQFIKDMESYKQAEKVETVKNVVADFPIIKCEVSGSLVDSNINEALTLIKERSNIELNRSLETDQDFADKELFNKQTKKARDALKTTVINLQNNFVSYAEFAATAKEIDSVLQKMQSHGEKQVKEGKQIKKDNIVNCAIAEVVRYIDSIDKIIDPLRLHSLMECSLNYELAMKGKRTIESLQNAVAALVADFKIKSNEVTNKVKQNLVTLDEFPRKYDFLFSDKPSLVTKSNEDLIAVIKTRIAEYEQAEKIKSQELREKIRIEEEAKAEKKIKNEQFAVQQKKDAEKAGELAKRTVEKREEEFVNTSSGEVVSGIDPDNAKQETEQDPELTLYNKITVWGLSHKVSTEAMTELEIILGIH